MSVRIDEIEVIFRMTEDFVGHREDRRTFKFPDPESEMVSAIRKAWKEAYLKEIAEVPVEQMTLGIM